MKNQRSSPPEYDRDETGRITKVSQGPFDLDRALDFWKLKEPDPVYRRFILSERKEYAERKGYLYEAQCCSDLLEAL